MKTIAIKYRFDSGIRLYEEYCPTLISNDTGGGGRLDSWSNGNNL